jgi:hypothetical protein
MSSAQTVSFKVLKGYGPVGYCPPEIAQLVERLTVEVTQRSDGPWFESGFPEAFLFLIIAGYSFAHFL